MKTHPPLPHTVTGHRTPYHQKCRLAAKMKEQPTPAEAQLAELVDGWATGYHFKRQRIVGPYILDFYCKQAKLCVEVDGGVHRRRAGYDAGRTQTLERRFGITVLRFTNEQVLEEPLTVAGKIVAECHRRCPISKPEKPLTPRDLRVLKRRLRWEHQTSGIDAALAEAMKEYPRT